MRLEREREAIIAHLRTLRHSDFQNIDNDNFLHTNAQLSNKIRKSANSLYIRKHHLAADHNILLAMYNHSLILAPPGSEELALAYSCRSALLLHFKKYKECIQDVDKALKITRCNQLEGKLTQRRKKCLSCMENESADVSQIKASAVKDEDLVSLVEIKHNDKYGRHLVATRDIKPGEVIFVEKPYVSTVRISSIFLYCSHCMNIAWNAIPCEHCYCWMFCSEKCKDEAWMQYHDLECQCNLRCLAFNQILLTYDLDLKISLRALIKGLRELGDLEKLKAEVQSIDECREERTRGFLENGKFPTNQFRSLYSLKVLNDEEFKKRIPFCIVTLVLLAKYTSFFGKKIILTPQKMIDNEDVIFTGSLLLRLSEITNINSLVIGSTNVFSKMLHDVSMNIIAPMIEESYVKGKCIVPFASLINHSCNPNAGHCFNDDLKCIVYALQPINKGDQIYFSYSSNFFITKNSHRRNFLNRFYKFSCDCRACKESWPTWPIFETRYEELPSKIKMNSKEITVWNKYKNLMASVEKEDAVFDVELLTNLSKAVESLNNSLDQPSIITWKTIHALRVVFEKLYGCQFQSFSAC